ncbi:type II CAAX prenyl endopeptidase Rce1 family protein [Microbacterium sp. SORGH_AS_0862]|uniref:CPBP family glutamic-type intramembrane protease n=1 Tax=Microbacterium sp. SORGH_AS_0862 TaxID=3041789 RepID=UPI0027D86474|nr:CPBP family glutamic-type intramembrane protease [Microbacterium sp. SORGH_AS_0862]
MLALDPASASLVLTGTTMLSAALGLIVLLTGGESPAATWTQVVFTAVFGLVAAQLVVLTDSLWPVIAWHALWDFTNTVGGNLSTPEALTGIGAAVVVLIMYSLVLGRRISAGAASGARR